MPIFIFSIMVDPATEVEIKEVAAPDFLLAVHTLASWRPGIHIVKFEGVFAEYFAHA